MSKPTDVYFIRGQGDQYTSQGIDWMARDVVGWNITGSRVRTYNWWQWQVMRDDVNSRLELDVVRMCVPFSMGANAFTWVLDGVDYQGQHAPGIKGGAFDWACWLDPTWASVITPLSNKHIKEGRHYKGTFPDLVGHGNLILMPPRPQIEVVDIFMEHLLIPVDGSVRGFVLDNLRRRMTS